MNTSVRSFFGDSAIYALSDVLVKSTQLILTPYYLTRLSVAEFGQFGIIVSTMAVGSVFFNLGFQSGIARHFYLLPDYRPALVGSIYAFLTLIALPVAPIVAIALHLSGVFDPESVGLGHVMLLVVSSAMFAIIVNNGIVLLKVQQEALQSGLLGLSASLTSMVAIICLIEFTDGPPLASIIRGQFIGVSVACLTALVFSREFLGKPSIEMFRKVFAYTRPLVPHNAFQWLLGNSDRFILIKLVGAEALGGYFFAVQFGSAIKLLGRSINSSVIHLFGRLAVEPELLSRTRSISRLYIASIAIIVAGVGLGVPFAIGLIPWDEYDRYLYLIPLLAGGAGMFCLYYLPMNLLTLTAGRSARLYRITMVAALLNLCLNLTLAERGVVVVATINIVTYSVLASGFALAASREPESPEGFSKLDLLFGAVAMVTTSVLAAAWLA